MGRGFAGDSDDRRQPISSSLPRAGCRSRSGCSSISRSSCASASWSRPAAGSPPTAGPSATGHSSQRWFRTTVASHRRLTAMEFRLLGPFEVVDHDRLLALGGRKQRSLLAILVLHANEVVSTDRLIDELWARPRRATAAKSIQLYVSGLRKELGEGRLVTRAPGYMLRVEPSELDLARFEQLLVEARATDPEDARHGSCARRWRCGAGRRWPISPTSPSPRAEIARLEELRWAALEQRIDADLASGRHAELVGELEALVDRASAPGASARPADARALPLGSPSRGARRVPGGQARARQRSSGSSRARS